jgi:pimeloyl-ACP methyl ester carboxylesterase
MRQIIVRFLPALVLAALQTSPALADSTTLAERLDAMGAEPCVNSGLTCLTIPMPRDHRANDPDQTIEITFAISTATTESKGVLIYAIGGPGGSGVAVAEGYLSAFDASLTENMDIVFFDQRGIGPVHGLECPDANAAIDTLDLPLENPDETIARTRAFVIDCIAELDAPDLLSVVNTDQAIRDLELFRQAIGAPRLWVYGESYGTQFAQQYATAFPASVRGVILDGVVDLSLSMETFYATYTRAAERILARVLAACDTIPACSADMQGDAAAVYDGLSARLDEGPISVPFPLEEGTMGSRVLTAGMLEASAFYALYGPTDRAYFLRALAAASRDDLLPMLRLGYSSLNMDTVTGDSVADPTWFGAAYYAITCSDYRDPGETEDAVIANIMAGAKALAPDAPRLLRSYFAERLICAFWPDKGSVARPAPFAGGDYPTLILNADTDPITSVTQAYSVFDNVQNGSLVIMQGGPHVIWGRGLACPDQIVADLLFDGKRPEAELQLCRQDFVEGYVPLTMTDPVDASDPLVIAQSLEIELGQSLAIYAWDWGAPLMLGCDKGGTVTLSAMDDDVRYSFDACQWWAGITIDGTGLYVENDEPGDGLTLTLSISGTHQGDLTYRNTTQTEAWSISGTWDGAAFITPRPVP